MLGILLEVVESLSHVVDELDGRATLAILGAIYELLSILRSNVFFVHVVSQWDLCRIVESERVNLIRFRVVAPYPVAYPLKSLLLI